MPVNLTLFAQMEWVAREPLSSNEFNNYTDQFSYFLQALLSRKFSSRFSIQAMPGYLMGSNTSDPGGSEGLLTLGLAGRMKLMSLVADYILVVGLSSANSLPVEYYNPLGLGLEIETGGHIFSLNFMNSEYILENNFLAQSKKSWREGGVRFGFTLSHCQRRGADDHLSH